MEDRLRELTEIELDEIAGGGGCGCDGSLIDVDVNNVLNNNDIDVNIASTDLG